MLVTPGELEELEHEGISVEYRVLPIAYLGKGEQIESIQFIRTKLGEPDESGRRRPVEIPGSEFEFWVNSVLLATGQFPDRSWIDESLQDGHENVFVAGDFATGRAR